LDTSESRSEIPGKFRNVVLEKTGEYELADRVQYEVLCTVKEEKNVLYTTKRGRLTGMVTSLVGTVF